MHYAQERAEGEGGKCTRGRETEDNLAQLLCFLVVALQWEKTVQRFMTIRLFYCKTLSGRTVFGKTASS